MGDDVVSRPEYELHMRAGLAEAANLLAAEAAAQQVAIERPFNGLRMRARPGATGAQVVVDWYYDLGCARETRQRQERDALRARAEAAEQRAEAAEASRVASELRLREVGQILIAEIGAAGPTFTEDVARAAVARIQAAEAEAERLRVVITKAVDDLPAWSAGALKHLSPAEVMADEVRMELRRALGGAA